jgi:hypothetical protein
MSNSPSHNINPAPGQDLPWYRQFWPWFIIALPASVVVASFITLWLAISNPDPLVIKDDDYQRLNSELKAQAAEQESEQSDSDGTTPRSN